MIIKSCCKFFFTIIYLHGDDVKVELFRIPVRERCHHMLEMLLKMTAATLLYVLITAGLWYFCYKKHRQGAGLNVLIGFIFGGCSIVANHLGIEYKTMLLNVRDIGPLSAGLFFSPVSGVLAGLIGGIARLVSGMDWTVGNYVHSAIGPFTTLACSLSTCLAGILSASLNKLVYDGKRPSAPHSFLLGALIEVFHMYSILILRQDEMQTAYSVVRTIAVPMIFFTAAGVALCSLIVRKLSGEQPDLGFGLSEEKIPLSTLFQRSMLSFIVILFVFNYAVTWQFNTRMARDDAQETISDLMQNAEQTYLKSRSTDELIRHIGEQYEVGNSFVLQDDSGTRLLSSGAGVQLDPEDDELLSAQPVNEYFTLPFKTWNGAQMMGVRVALEDDLSLSVLLSVRSVYLDRDNQVLENTLSDILLFSVLYILVVILAERLVVRNLKRVNVSLGKITEGNLNEEVWVRSSSEFSKLSDDINQTVSTLRGYIHAAEQKMEDELKFAASIQDSALPKNFHIPYDRIELFALMDPAKQVGGDFYDFFFVNPTSICLVIADVSGKGVPASLFMMRAKTSIKYYARSGNSPSELLANVNNALCEDNDAEMFVTVWLGILDFSTGLMRCANAGHEYPVLMQAGGDYELLKGKHGLMLGAFEGSAAKEYEIQFNPGDRFFVYTDGVPEAMNEKNEQYGTARMVEQLNKLKNRDQQNLLEGMLQDIKNYAGTAEQFDDITMLGFTFK